MVPLFAFLDNPVMLLLFGAIAVMLFGERLPEVARSLGKGLMELKSGVRNLQRELGIRRELGHVDRPAARAA